MLRKLPILLGCTLSFAACHDSSTVSAPPPPGANLQAVATSPNEVRLRWEPVTDGSVMLFRDDLPISAPQPSTGFGAVVVAEWLDATVRAGTAYRYAIEVRDDRGVIVAYDVATVATPPTSARWDVATVGETGGIGTSAVAVDAAGVLHVVFHDAIAGALVHGRDDGSGLVFDEIARGDRAGVVADLALDATGVPHVVLGFDEGLFHATLDGANAWVMTAIDRQGRPGSVALVVDAAGDLQVVARSDVDSSGLTWWTGHDGRWIRGTAPVFGALVGTVDAAATADGFAVLCFVRTIQGDLAVGGAWNGALWSVRTLLLVDRPAGGIGPAADGSWVAALFVDGDVGLATSNDRGVAYESITSAGSRPQSIAMAVSRFGDVHLAVHGHSSDLQYLLRFDGVWTEEFVDADGDMGEHPAIALAPEGRVELFYNDPLGGTLRRATAW